jgi:hypothetical protein
VFHFDIPKHGDVVKVDTTMAVLDNPGQFTIAESFGLMVGLGFDLCSLLTDLLSVPSTENGIFSGKRCRDLLIDGRTAGLGLYFADEGPVP